MISGGEIPFFCSIRGIKTLICKGRGIRHGKLEDPDIIIFKICYCYFQLSIFRDFSPDGGIEPQRILFIKQSSDCGIA